MGGYAGAGPERLSAASRCQPGACEATTNSSFESAIKRQKSTARRRFSARPIEHRSKNESDLSSPAFRIEYGSLSHSHDPCRPVDVQGGGREEEGRAKPSAPAVPSSSPAEPGGGIDDP
jgi:hypothetical protein